MTMRILHVGSNNRFTVPLSKLFRGSFDTDDQLFLVRRNRLTVEEEVQVPFVRRDNLLSWAIELYRCVAKAERVILHALDTRVVLVLCLQPWSFRKCYWVIWGGDLYAYETDPPGMRRFLKQLIRGFAIKRIGHIVTFIERDYERAKEWYGTTAEFHHCLIYPNVIFEPDASDIERYRAQASARRVPTVMVGNSSLTFVHHLHAFRLLSELRSQDFRVFCPVAYPDRKNAQLIADAGKAAFGGRFSAQFEYLGEKEYLGVLESVDIAIMPFPRQQAVANIVPLLGMGKKVYIPRRTSTWDLCNSLGLVIYDLDELSLDPIPPDTALGNIRRVREQFSKDKAIAQWSAVLGVPVRSHTAGAQGAH